MSNDDFVEGAEHDEFDPAELEKAVEQFDDLTKEDSDHVRDLLERRRQAYSRVFTAGTRDQADIDIVLADLAWFCRAFAPTFDKNDGVHADILMKIKEGRREVHSRIKDFSGLDSDAILLKYTDATTK